MSSIKKIYQSKLGVKYAKDDEGNLFIEIDSQKEKTENLCIINFQEGDYGLWIETEAPYFIEGDNIVSSDTGTKATKNEVLSLEENQFLKKEERIKDNFLWIYPGETIVFPVKEEKETKTDKSESTTNANSTTNNQQQAEERNNSTANDGSNAAGEGQFYVCAGAELKCSCGDKNSNLKVVSGHNSEVCGKLIANVMDYQPMTNIQPFGKCQTTNNPQVAAATAANHGNLKPQPCVPNIPAPWVKVKDDVEVGKQAALLEGSKLTCAYSGKIEIVDPGQSILKE